MSKKEKLRRKLRNNPKDATMQEVETLLTRFGFRLIRIRGSHHIFRNGAIDIIIPLHGRKVGMEYVKEVILILDRLFPESENEEESDE
jgi:predicted RNA binding protein YcfA (HicA-like mRNA interferase family)